MIKKIAILALVLTAQLFYFNASGQGYEIGVQIKGLSNNDLILGHHFNDKLFPDDTIQVNNNGKGVFKGEEPLKGGMYIVLTPDHGYFDLLIDQDQTFSVVTDTTHLVRHMKIEGSRDNELFYDYQKFMLEKRQRSEELSKQKQTANEEEKKAIDAELKEISEDVMAFRDKVIEENPDLFVSIFLKATKDIEVPDPPKDAEGNIIDSAFQYNYYKSHYFDHFDPGDPRLLRTPLYEKKVMHYMQKVIPQSPDSIIKAVDMLIKKSRSDQELFRYMLITLFNHYAKSEIMGMDKVYLHIADEYYIDEATWSDAEFIEKLKETVAKNKSLVIGNKAPDAELFEVPHQHFINAQDDTSLAKNPHIGMFKNIHDYRSPFLVLAFWEADCGHCKKVIPKLHKLYLDTLQDNNIEVVAIHTLGGVEGKEKWIDFVNQHELYEWVNCWNPYSYDYKVKYNVETTPSIFILDQNKKIIAKKIGPDQIIDVVNAHKKMSKK